MSNFPTEQDLIRQSKHPRVTMAAIEANIVAEHTFTAYEGRMGSIVEGNYESIGKGAGTDLDLESLKRTTFCVLVLANGFTVHGISTCVDIANFDREIGRAIARKNAIDQIWPLMGYELKTQLSGNEPATVMETDEDIAKVFHQSVQTWNELNDRTVLNWDELDEIERDERIWLVHEIRKGSESTVAGLEDPFLDKLLRAIIDHTDGRDVEIPPFPTVDKNSSHLRLVAAG